jgi:hypothetical protein
VLRLHAEPDARTVRVVTSDRVLANLAHGAGATVEGADSFRLRIETA